MRLVGASNLYISLPFLMETLVAAIIGAALASGAIGLVMWFVYSKLRNNSQIVEWVAWADAVQAVGLIAVVGVLITLVPTLVMTRKYLKV